MKNFMNKVSAKANELAFNGYMRSMEIKEKVCFVFEQRSGEGFVDTALFS